MVAALAADLAKLGDQAGRQGPLPHDQHARISRRRFSPACGSAPFRCCRTRSLAGASSSTSSTCRTRRCFCSPITCATIRATAGLRPDVKRMIVTGMGQGMGLAGRRRTITGFGHRPARAVRRKPRHARLHRLHLRHHRQAQGRGACASLARSARRFKPRPRAAAAGRRHPRHRRMELHQRARPQCAVSAAKRHHRLDHGGPRRARAHPADHRARPRHAAALGRHALPPHPRHARHREPL